MKINRFLKYKFLGLVLGISATIFPLAALAHQPVIVAPGHAIVKIDQPEISRAYYGDLAGNSQYFEINSVKPFVLYLNLLVPKTAGQEKDLLAEIFYGPRAEELMAALDGPRYQWREFYEPFGGDHYWQGPEYRQTVQPGRYLIRVFTISNQGQYVLAVGEQESLAPAEIIRTLPILWSLKANFFFESPLGFVSGYIGLGLLLVVVILILLIAIPIFLIVRKILKKRRQNYQLKI